MGRRILEHVQRKLYAESMGRCMNPHCRADLFAYDGNIVEKAHIRPYCDTEDNAYENLIILCPNCHTNFDKNFAFTADEVKHWKQIRKDEVDLFFNEKYKTFRELSAKIKPLLQQNKSIYENYYLGNQKQLWSKFEHKIIVNNSKIKKILSNNLNLIQFHKNKDYSNLELIYKFLAHIDEFETTRFEDEKIRCILFPAEINSLFGIAPVEDFLLPSVESLETLINKLQQENNFISLTIGCQHPYIVLKENQQSIQVFLHDSPKLRQLYFDYKCFRRTTVRLESLNFAFMYMHSKKVAFKIADYRNLTEISINGIKIKFIYEYCLSKVSLMQLPLEHNTVIVNLHDWNGSCCISNEAHDFAKTANITLLTMKGFYGYINKLNHN